MFTVCNNPWDIAVGRGKISDSNCFLMFKGISLGSISTGFSSGNILSVFLSTLGGNWFPVMAFRIVGLDSGFNTDSDFSSIETSNFSFDTGFPDVSGTFVSTVLTGECIWPRSRFLGISEGMISESSNFINIFCKYSLFESFCIKRLTSSSKGFGIKVNDNRVCAKGSCDKDSDY